MAKTGYTEADLLRWVEKHKKRSNTWLLNSIKLEHLAVYDYRMRKEIEAFDAKYP